jgi:hypothetical protein
MWTPSHLAKFRRLDAMLDRLDPIADQELWIWTAMNACVNLLNGALHRCGVTEETDSFHTQVEGVYAVPDRAAGVMNDRMHAPGDVMHAGQPALPGAMPPAIQRAGDALRRIEDLREPYVRGAKRARPDDVDEWRAAYATCVRELSALLGETGNEP